jgi:UDP-N-acetylglucosamine 2-epimerase (non-hydrolysing)
MAPVILALRKRPAEFRCIVVVTAQHRHMLDQVLSLFGIAPDHDLDVMTQGQSLTGVTIRVLARLEPLLQAQPPDMMLVHGDTTTTMAASLAAFYHQIPVGHVEAGLRSFDKHNPFPEELNRVVADALSAIHFAPTLNARRNLLNEGVPSQSIVVTGNTGVDALRLVVTRLRTDSLVPSRDTWRALAKHSFVLVTAHRRETFGRPLTQICMALNDVAKTRPDLHFIYPVHPNPNVEGPVRAALGGRANIHLLPPLEYSDFLYFVKRCRFIVTDSGGLQEEGPSLGKPVLVLRDVTERPEAVKAGTARIVGTNREMIRRWIIRLLDDDELFRRMATAVNPYGDGRAATRTVEAIRFHFGLRRTKAPEFKAHR